MVSNLLEVSHTRKTSACQQPPSCHASNLNGKRMACDVHMIINIYLNLRYKKYNPIKL